MIKLKLLLITFLTLSAINVAAETTRQLCALPAAEAERVTNFRDIQGVLCRQANQFGDQTVQDLLGIGLPALDRYLQDTTLEEDGSTFSYVLDATAARYNELAGPGVFTPRQESNLASSITELTASFGSQDQRWANPQAYAAKLQEVLSHTQEGRRVLDCFNRTENDRVAGNSIQFIPQDESVGEYGPSTAFFDTELNSSTNQFTKVITIDPGPSATETLTFLAHELQHSCDTEILMAQVDEINELGSPDILPSDVQIRHDRERALSEIKAYAMMPNMFKELAATHPQYFCNYYASSNLFGARFNQNGNQGIAPQIISSGTYYSTIESQLASGNFLNTIIDFYTLRFGYDPASFYQMEDGGIKRDAQGSPVLLAEVRTELAAGGFNVL